MPLQKLFQGVVGVAHGLVYLHASLREFPFILLRNPEGMMVGGREYGGHEWLAHIRHFEGKPFHEGFVPDGPISIEILVSGRAAVGGEIFPAVVVFEPYRSGEAVESH